MKKIFLLLVFFTISVFGQNLGYKINVETKNLKDDCIFLSLYNGTSKNSKVFDSIKIEKDLQTVTFSQTKKIIPFIIQVRLRDKKIKKDILIDNGSILNFNLSSKDLNDFSTKDPLNKDFLLAQDKIVPKEKLELLKQLEKKFPQNSLLKLYTTIEERRLDKDFNTKYLAETRRAEFLKGIDLNDKKIKILPNIFPFLYSYITLFPIDKENYIKSEDILLKGQNCDSPNFMFYLDWLFKNLDYNYGNKDYLEIYKYTFNTYMNDTKCIEKYGEKYNKVLATIQNTETLPIGAIIPKFSMNSIDNKEIKIEEIYPKTKYTVIVFYDPDCIHCQEEMPKIVSFFDKMDSEMKAKITKIAFLNTEITSKWQSFVKDNQLEDWINVNNIKDKDLNNKLGNSGNPNFLLINEEGKVLYKRYVESELLKIFVK